MTADLSRLKIEGKEQLPNSGGWLAGGKLLKLVLGLLLAVALGFWLGSGRSGSGRQEPAGSAVKTEQEQAAALKESGKEAAGSESKSATAAPINKTLTATGFVVAQRQASVSSKATGVLRELRVVEGDQVKAGELLGVIENDDLQALVHLAEAKIGAAEAGVVGAEAALREAALSLERTRSLRQRGANSPADLDTAEALHDRLAAELLLAKANLKAAQAELDRAKVDVRNTEIRSPFDGTVLTKTADVGEVVSPMGASVDARAALVSVADMSSLQVEADVSEANIAKVRVGQKAQIVLDSYPEVTYDGVVEKIVPTVDRAKATVLTKIRFLALDDRVLPEMSAKVVLFVEE